MFSKSVCLVSFLFFLAIINYVSACTVVKSVFFCFIVVFTVEIDATQIEVKAATPLSAAIYVFKRKEKKEYQ